MKRISSLPVPALVLLLLAIALPAAAQSASGSFQFTFDSGTKSVDFNARMFGSGARGEMTFTGTTDFSDQDGDGTGEIGLTGPVPVTIKVDFDCLVVNGNRAAMSGLITQSSVPGYVGRRGLLTVEDNGEGVKAPAPDRFTWGLYHRTPTGWVPSDAELLVDTGVGLTWLATDFEREDDVPVSSQKLEPGDCKGFSLSSYAFQDLVHGNGNIQVRP